MLSVKAMIFSYPKQKKYMCFCSATEVFNMMMACFHLFFFPHLNALIPQGPYEQSTCVLQQLELLHNCEQNDTYFFYLIILI